EERLYPHTVTDQEQLLGPGIPDREGEHAIEPLGELVSPLQIGAQHDLRVAAGIELVPELPQLAAQLDEIVDFARVDEGGRRPALRLVQYRLRASRQSIV